MLNLTSRTCRVIMTGVSFKTSFWLTIILMMMVMMLGESVVTMADPLEQLGALTRPIEFDYVSWTLDAIGLKLGQIALNTSGYLAEKDRSSTVLEVLGILQQINQLEARLNDT